MATPSEVVGQTLDAIADPLGAFIDGVMSEAAPGKDWVALLEARDEAQRGRPVRHSTSDPRFLLRVITENRHLFRGKLPDTGIAWASELRTMGNLWAHREEIDEQSARRCVDTAALLVHASGALDAASAIREFARDLEPVTGERESAAAERDADARAGTATSGSDDPGVQRGGPVTAGHTKVSHSPGSIEGGVFAPASLVLEGYGLTVMLAYIDGVNFALAHNRVSPLVAVVVENSSDTRVGLSSLEIELVAPTEDPLADPIRLGDLTLDPGESVQIDRAQLRMRLHPHAFAQLSEALPASEFALTVHTSRGRLHGTGPVPVLARTEWWAVSVHDALAAFVRPADRTIAALVSEASDILAERTGNASLLGYQGGSARAVEEARAVFDAMTGRRIRYIDPPPSFEGTGQKIRDHSDVLDGRFGTCLDLATTYAAALEFIGLNPVIVVAQGHAFAGFLADEGQLDELALPARTHANTIANLYDSGSLIAVETTETTASDQPRTFDSARNSGGRRIRSGLADMRYVLDVRAAHRRVRPLPTAAAASEPSDDSNPSVRLPTVAPGGGFRRPDVVPAPTIVPVERTADAFPPRVEKWRNALLDLSFRNPLLNLRTRTSGLDLHIPAGSLAEFEDGVAAGHPFRLIPHDKIAEVHQAQGARFAQDIETAELARILDEEHAVFCSTTIDRYTTRLTGLQRRARTVEQETGANNLYLTLGSLNWTDGTRERVDAPLFLLPVRLVGSRTRGFALQIEEGAYAVPNQCLLEKLRVSFNLKIPAYEEPQLDSSGIDLPDALQQIRLALLDAKLDFRVDEVAKVAIIQFSTLQMWQDLSANWAAFAENRVVRHLIETPTDSFGDADDEPAFDASLEADAFLPIPADGSQLEAIQWAAEGRSFVLEGPPGTGKSQTITNMIAHLLATGKRVLFVAEKQAALGVVKRRLDASGIGTFALDVHGRTQTPAEVRRQLRDALNASGEGNAAAWEALRAQYRALVAGLAQYPNAVHEVGPAGESAWTARQTVLALGAFGDHGTSPAADPSVVQSTDAAQRARDVAPRAAAAVQAMADNPRHHPWSLAGAGVSVREDSPQIVEALSALDAAVSALAQEPYFELAFALTTGEQFAAARRWLDGLASSEVPGPATAKSIVTEAWTTQVRDAQSALTVALEAAARGLDHFQPPVWDADLTTPLADAREADGKFFKGKRRRRIIEAITPLVSQGSTLEPKTLTSTLERAVEAQTALRAAVNAFHAVSGLNLPADFNPLVPGAATLPQERAQALHASAVLAYASPDVIAAAERLIDTWGVSDGPAALHYNAPPTLDNAPLTTPPQPAPLPQGGAALGAFLGAWDGFCAAVGATDASRAEWSGGRTLLPAIEADLPHWRTDSAGGSLLRLSRWIDVLTACGELSASGLPAFSDAILAAQVSGDELERLVRLAIARAALDERLAAMGLSGFDDVQRAQLTRRFLETGDDLRKRMVQELPARIVSARSFAPGRFRGRVGELDREASRKRGGLTIRGMFEKYGSVIGEVTPCLLMSPHSIARFLPSGALDVDVVIFDEASQIRVAESVGAMGRGASVIVVGDSRQMPPTSFAQVNLDDADADVAPPDEVLAPQDQESILSEAVETRMARLWLTWHYRSADESLISFSNHRYYDGRLSSFPGPPERRDGLGVSFRRVEGVFDRGGRGATRTNRIEAESILAEIRARLRDDPSESIGVVTFNSQQADLVLTMLEECGDPNVAAALERDDDASTLFVKNLENVQGDERDTILFSLAFSVDPTTGLLPLNFGPLNRAGGERRLNVAITRARREVVLFASFDPHHIDERRTSAAALLDLKEYLTHAKDASDGTARVRALSATDLHRDEVRDALRERGLEVVENVGMSSFTVDLAVRLDDAHPWVAVMLDGPGWSARRTVGDRDALPSAVLVGRMGWDRVERVYLPSWLHRRDEVINGLVSAASAPAGSGSTAMEAPEHPVPAQPEPPHGPSAATPPARNGLIRGTPVLSSATVANDDGSRDETIPRFTPASDAPRRGLDVSTLDELPASWAAAKVREVALRVAEEEGPVQQERLARIVARRFGLSRVRQDRIDAILATLPRGRRERTSLGTYIWPENTASSTYAGYRVTPSGVPRPIDEIAPHEVANAMAEVAASSHGIETDELIREVAELFDYRRITAPVRARLSSVVTWAIAENRLEDHDGLVLPTSDSRPKGA
ncbi:DUF4011 domain-containing protein [Demequina lignilytica]|uniref:DUF4011 domain-containing protein n=1 Tax=Demequina lignilytica TaxID=3051663 RepID=A0AB35MHJ7_9MICO|nr:DUF4011 domain-containing protein [Demequina sp. SYSU T0a273]MDN4483202.1 DUF4011 domain-containing protein [Demequina sp. SYSU T0a273]